MTLRLLDLFSGIGGFSLGLERTGGFKTVAFCEIDPFCRKVLAKHWPEVPCYNDVRELTADRLKADGISVDVICGGFPCQDISIAGLGAGLKGERSGLWSEYARIIGEVRPGYVIVENVAALLSRGLDHVLGDLASLGFNAEWHCIPASAVGAPHRRDRIWIVANSNGSRALVQGRNGNCHDPKWHEKAALQERKNLQFGTVDAGSFADASSSRRTWAFSSRLKSQLASAECGNWWATEPNVGRVAHGVPDRAHRLKALGNAVVPQIPELIGNAILASLKQAEAAA